MNDNEAYEWHQRKGVDATWSKEAPFTIEMRVGHTIIAVDHEVAEALADAILRLIENAEMELYGSAKPEEQPTTDKNLRNAIRYLIQAAELREVGALTYGRRENKKQIRQALDQAYDAWLNAGKLETNG